MVNISEHLQLSWILTNQKSCEAWTKRQVGGSEGLQNVRHGQYSHRQRSGPKVFDVRYVECVNPMPSPKGQANRKACCRWYGVRWWKKRRQSCNGVDTDWEPPIRHYLSRKGADVHRICFFSLQRSVDAATIVLPFAPRPRFPGWLSPPIGK